MKHLWIVAFCLFIALSGCEPLVVQTTQINEYGPRWIDYAEWGRLELGMTKSEVIQTLGEPFMTKRAQVQNGVNAQSLVFKVRSKYYQLREPSKKTRTLQSGAAGESDNVTIGRERKPEKFADKSVWGDVMNLFCTFTNGKLTEWHCPEMVALERHLQKDSLDSTKAIITGSAE